jgi:transcription elongation GreA/GreB family factor
MDKSKLHRTVIQQLEDSLHRLQQYMQQLIEDAANDSKSSVGDKHETTRAQVHLEQEKLSQAISNIEQQLQVMERLSVEISVSIRAGSVVETSIGWMYFSVPNIVLEFEGLKIRCISSSSPFGKMLMLQQKGNVISFNKQNVSILTVY